MFRIHAVQRMSEHGITERDVREIRSAGETIEEYPADTPYASRLVLGWCGGRPLHVDPTLWEPGFRQRQRPWNA